MSSGSLSAMCDEAGDAQFTRKQLKDARQSIKRDLEFLLRNSDRDAESNPFRRAAAVTPCLPSVSIEAECAFPDGNTGFAMVPDTSNTMGIFNLPQCTKGRESRMEDFEGNSWEMCCKYVNTVETAKLVVDMDDEESVLKHLVDLAITTGEWHEAEKVAPLFPNL